MSAVEHMLVERVAMLEELQHNLQHAQSKMKAQTDYYCHGATFIEGKLVYAKLLGPIKKNAAWLQNPTRS